MRWTVAGMPLPSLNVTVKFHWHPSPLHGLHGTGSWRETTTWAGPDGVGVGVGVCVAVGEGVGVWVAVGVGVTVGVFVAVGVFVGVGVDVGV